MNKFMQDDESNKEKAIGSEHINKDSLIEVASFSYNNNNSI